MVPDLLCIWVAYLLVRICLILRHWVELTHLNLVELPVQFDGPVLVRLTYIVWCIWNRIQYVLQGLEAHLKRQPRAEQAVWIPEIGNYPLGYS